MQDDGLSDEFAPIGVQLRDGRLVRLRAIRPEDRSALAAAFERLSADTRYSRFMGTMKGLSDQMLESAVHPAAEREFALVAVSGEGAEEIIVGGARYGSAAGSDSCEFAVMMVDDWQGLGLARQLMELLILIAKAHGYRTMEGYVLASNTPMRQLAARLGFEDGPCPGDAGVRIVTRRLVDEGEQGTPRAGAL
jgi:RimJ/RimL family protein N-acetyltransferase